jgi:hypothetical protein
MSMMDTVKFLAAAIDNTILRHAAPVVGEYEY